VAAGMVIAIAVVKDDVHVMTHSQINMQKPGKLSRLLAVCPAKVNGNIQSKVRCESNFVFFNNCTEFVKILTMVVTKLSWPETSSHFSVPTS
jgi:hypothetical protein